MSLSGAAGHGLAAGDAGADIEELARQVNGTAQSQANVIYADYLRGLNAVEASVGACTRFLREYGGRPAVARLLLRQDETPGDIFFTAPSDIEALEQAVGKPIDLTQIDLETCVRLRDQAVGKPATLDGAAGFAALRGTLRKCIAAAEGAGPNAAGIAILQRVSRTATDPTYTSATTLARLERAVGDLPIDARDLEACSDAYHVNVVVEQSLLRDNPPPCTSGETGCPTGPPGSGGSCCSPGETCVRPTCRNCEAYCQTPGCFPASATVQLEDGTTKAMPDVRLGDRVLVARADGGLGYEDVYLNTHKDAVTAAPYVELALASGRSLSLSPRHFIPVVAGPDGRWDERVTKAGNEVVAGDFVWSRTADGRMELDRVAAAETKVAVGAYNPLTMNGTIVVDGVVASAHSDWFLDGLVSADTQAKVYQAVLAPVRVAYGVIGPERMTTVAEGWGLVDAVRVATTPRAGGAAWSWAGLGLVLAVGAAAFAWRRRAVAD